MPKSFFVVQKWKKKKKTCTHTQIVLSIEHMQIHWATGNLFLLIYWDRKWPLVVPVRSSADSFVR